MLLYIFAKPLTGLIKLSESVSSTYNQVCMNACVNDLKLEILGHNLTTLHTLLAHEFWLYVSFAYENID